MYATLSRDETPMVRKAVYVASGPLATVLGKEHVRTEVLPVLRQLAEDPADSTRIHCVEALLAIAPIFVGGMFQLYQKQFDCPEIGLR